MRAVARIMCIGLMLLTNQFAHAFENLDFESAMPVITGDRNLDRFQQTVNVLPHWSPFGFDPDLSSPGKSVLPTIYFNGGHVGEFPPIFNVYGGGFEIYPQGVIAGDYSLQVYATLEAELFQTGHVPPSSKSIRFTGDIIDTSLFPTTSKAGPFELLLGGEPLSLRELGPIGDYKEYGANIPASLADTEVELRFKIGVFLEVRLDDIRFSPIPVPEPSSHLLLLVASLIMLARQKQFVPF